MKGTGAKTMVLFTIEDMVAATSATLLQRGSREIAGVSTDTRTIRPGDLFVALKGPNFDGTAFVKNAFESGAGGAVVPKGFVPGDIGPDFTLAAVDDTLKALQDLAGFHRQRVNPYLAGITGSNGKTTTKDMLASIFSLKGPVLKTQGNFNNEIGLPLTLLKLQPDDERAVVEMGMSAEGEIRLLSKLARPDVAVITNIGAAHLLGLGSIHNVARAKAEILEGLKEDGVAVLNADDDLLMKATEGFSGRRITFGIGETGDVRGSDIILDHRGRPTFILHYRDEAVTVKLALTGRHNVYNGLAAAAAALAAGFTTTEIRQGLESVEGAAMRMEVRETAGRRIIVDCYNANPGSMKAAIDTLATLHGRKWAVLGDMLELGDTAAELHRETGRRAAAVGLRGLVLMGDHAGSTADGAKAGGMDERFIFVCERHEEAADILLEHSSEGETILVKGSRGAKMERIVEALEARCSEV
ncbi:MAG: UDP-N-acetylmuramoyl-tripeptide--D-alanyl-D-alanine ligase [Nitrospirota bacterium]|nr:UDP-N-acetylmuramoyl-tripeptide--D-alanyl-D-alanine ligase [Nitrospirota bacterium]